MGGQQGDDTRTVARERVIVLPRGELHPARGVTGEGRGAQRVAGEPPRADVPGPRCLPAGESGPPQSSTMTECFDCDNCKESLYGRKYIQMDNGPYCIPCYDAHFANTCDECKELIGHDCRVSARRCCPAGLPLPRPRLWVTRPRLLSPQELYYEDRHYHEHCFRCFRCDRSLADEPFTCQDEELLCNDCYCSEFSSKCIACEKTVMPGRGAGLAGVSGAPVLGPSEGCSRACCPLPKACSNGGACSIAPRARSEDVGSIPRFGGKGDGVQLG